MEVPRPGAHIPARVRNDIEHTAMPSAMGGGNLKVILLLVLGWDIEDFLNIMITFRFPPPHLWYLAMV